VYLVVPNIVHRSGQFAGLTIYRSGWRLSAVRQPGERRNLRVGHSVRDQDLIALRVVADRSWVTYVEGYLVRWPATDYSLPIRLSLNNSFSSSSRSARTVNLSVS